MKYTVLKTNDNNTVDVELVFNEHNEFTIVTSNVELGEKEADLKTNIIDRANTINAELTKNLPSALPYQPTLDTPVNITLE